MRMVAKKVRIFDIINGKFFPGKKEQMIASYVITPFGEKLSRVNLIATVVEKFVSESENYAALLLEDGSGAIRAKFFGTETTKVRDIEPGQLVLIIGKLKEYDGEIYVNPEIIRVLHDPNYEILRAAEILENLIERKKIVDEIKSLMEKYSYDQLSQYVKEKYEIDDAALQVIIENLRIHRRDFKPFILELIASLDRGNGVEIGQILASANLPENVIESAINELLEQEKICEIAPGILKIKK